MVDDVAIKVENVYKSFKLPHEKTTSIKGAVVNFWNRKRTFEQQNVLRDITFEIKKGEFFGIVGRNGSGKSTLLKLLAGIYSPNQGDIQINGKLTPFIELGVGFNPELTGRENVFLNGALLGFSRKDMSEMYGSIVEFAELGRFMDQKLKNYSSGMQVRLAFSIAIRAKSDILLIDEVLAVGDAAFQTKCFDYFYELKKTGTTVIFVSHDRGSLERFCDRGILIDEGKITERGSINKVMKEYTQIVLGELEGGQSKPVAADHKEPTSKIDYASISDVKSTDENGRSRTKFNYGDKINLGFKINIKKDVNDPIIGVTVWAKNVNRAVFATNTLIDGTHTGAFSVGDQVVCSIPAPENLNDGEYYIEPAVANETATLFFDQIPRAATFYIAGSNNSHSVLSSDSAIQIKKVKR